MRQTVAQILENLKASIEPEALLRDLIAAASPFAEKDIWRGRDIDDIERCKADLDRMIRKCRRVLAARKPKP